MLLTEEDGEAPVPSAFVVGGDIGAERTAGIASLPHDLGPVLEQTDVGRGLGQPIRIIGHPAIVLGPIVIEPRFSGGGEAEPLQAVFIEPCVVGSRLLVDVLEFRIVALEASGNGGVAGAVRRSDAADIVQCLIVPDPVRLSLSEQRLLALDWRGRIEEPLAPANEIIVDRERAGDSANQSAQRLFDLVLAAPAEQLPVVEQRSALDEPLLPSIEIGWRMVRPPDFAMTLRIA